MNTLVKTMKSETSSWIKGLESHDLLGPLFRGEINKDGYAQFLFGTRHYVSESQRILRDASEALNALEGWSVSTIEMKEKEKEETGHERWADSDLQGIGYSPSEIRSSSPNKAVIAYRAYVDHMIYERDPAAVFGLAYPLEALAARRGGSTVNNLLAAKKIPNIQNAIRFLRGHSDADVHHIKRLEQQLSRIEDPRRTQAILDMSRHQRELYPRFFA